ncbi:hypothetical protein [Microbacterium album]|uniref:Holliday junction nuclease RuvC n=1 Tax=Microbacterium album TaxID=2053191 RepID=A0A917IDT3_9MICO|nr:hypothetical protein [Microbacterium album]GGH33957.1 hypothetical protein GCM10010921_01290 [Microbacterium album]
MNVLGVDPSLTCSGVAVVEWNAGSPIAAPFWDTWRARAAKPEVATVAATRRRIRVMLREILAFVPATLDLAVVEGPSFGSRTALSLADERAGLRWMLIDQLMARVVSPDRVVVVQPRSRALLATGSGKASKTQVLDTVRALVPGAHIPNHDVADAVALAAAGAHHLGLSLPYSDAQSKAHARIAWPTADAA